jgi:hypothetical protein
MLCEYEIDVNYSNQLGALCYAETINLIDFEVPIELLWIVEFRFSLPDIKVNCPGA